MFWVCKSPPQSLGVYYNPHFADKEQEAQRGRVICPRSLSWQVGGRGLWPHAPAPRSSSGGSQGWEPGAALVSTPLTLVPPAHSGAQACVTLTNRTGFLCHDRRSCISASGVCDGVRNCPHGEDEEEALCREYLLSPAPALGGPSRALWGLPPSYIYPCSQNEVQLSLKLPGTFVSSGLRFYGPQPGTPAPNRTHK